MPRDVLPPSLGSGVALGERLKTKKIFRRKIVPIPAAAWEPLATILDGLRWLSSSVTPEHEARYQEDNRAKQRFQAALVEIAETAPVLLRRYTPVANLHVIRQTADLARARVEVLRSLEGFIPQVQSLFLEADAPSYLHWHDFAVDLADAFRAAVRITNPGHPLGIGLEGPVVRFLAEVAIPYVSGERVERDAIRNYLRAHTGRGMKSPHRPSSPNT